MQRTRIVLNIIALLFLFTACSPPGEHGVQLLLGTDQLQPTSTFEIRFDQPVAGEAQLGLVATNCPLAFRPPLPGKFVWLSQRSGVFTPAEPLQLGTSYRVQLAPGLRRANGEPVRAVLNRTLETPAFALETVASSSSLPSSNISAEPSISLEFNAGVLAHQAEPFLEFRGGTVRIPARVRHASEHEWFGYRAENASIDSISSWRLPLHYLKPASTNSDEPRLLANKLVLVPVRRLTPGLEWKLVVARGLPAVDASLKLAAQREIRLGTVQPFTIESVETHNTMSTGKRLTIQFSKGLSPDITISNAADWFVIEPVPKDLKYQLAWNRVAMSGQFLLGSKYTLQIRKGFPAQEGFTLETGFTTNRLQFHQVPPRLYLPAFETEQLGWGNREFPVLSVNVPRVQVRAKRLDRHNLIHALRGYRSYFRRNTFQDYDSEEPFHGLDYNLVAGRTIFERTFSPDSRLDVSDTTVLNWDDIIGIGKFGAVFLEAAKTAEVRASEKLGAQAVVQVTDLGIVWKKSKDQTFVHVFSLQSGAPSAKVPVRLLSDENETVAEALTDETGAARFGNFTNAMWILAESGQDIHALQLKDYGLPLYGFSIPVDYSEETAPAKGLLFSDREVYRPGDTFYLKAICRKLGEAKLAMPAKATALLRCFDSKDQKFYETNLVLSAYGSLSHALKLPNGPLGYYRAELVVDDHTFDHGFSVQQYHPNTFEIICSPKPSFAAGEKVELPVSAQYYMGKSLSRAQVNWVLKASDAGFRPEGYEGFTFCADDNVHNLDRSATSLSLNGTASSLSNLVLAPDIPVNPKAPQPRSASLEIVVTDVDQQTISRSVQFQCQSSDYYFGLKRPRDVLSVGEKLGLDFAAVGPDGSPIPGSIQATVRVSRVEWQSVRVQGAGRSYAYRSEPVSTNVLQRQLGSRKIRKNADKWEWADDKAAQFTPTEPGFYLVEVQGTDTAGHPVFSTQGTYVYGKESLGWSYRNPSQIDLVPQEKSYKPGQTATLLVKTPISGHALVTVERERVLRSFVTELEGNAPVVQVPLVQSDGPNVFVSVMMLRGSAQSPRKIRQPEFRLGYCQIRVEQPEVELKVHVRPGTNDYLPGEYVQLEARVEDAAGHPLPDAEVTLYAVDEGVLSLTGYHTPDPLSFFYQPHALAVHTGLSLPDLLPEDPEQLNFSNKGYLVGGGGVMNRLRKKFAACAFWDGDLRTDKDGMVKASFRAPDNLTRYRVIAVAQTAKHQFGKGEAAFQVNKPVMLEPVLPRFANVGDKLVARALVLSRHPVAGEVEVSLKLDGKASTTNSLPARIKLPANGSVFVEIPLEFSDIGSATWEWTARFFEAPGLGVGSPRFFLDSVQTTIPVGYPAPLMHEIHLSRTGASETNLLAPVNPQLLEGKGTIAVSVSNTRLSELAEAVSQLLHYPYGCVEQTSSSLLPWIVLQDLEQALPEIKKRQPEMKDAIRAGIERLLSMQTASGGLSYWPGAKEPIFWGSAYGGMVLALASRQGHSVPQAAWDKLSDYLGSELRRGGSTEDPQQSSERCLALFALALGGRAEHALQETIYQKRHLLGAESRAMLALAVAESNGPPGMLQDLLQTPLAPESRLEDWFGCPARDVAIQLLAWLRYQPAAPRVDVLVTELMKSQQKGHWLTTQGNAWVMFALTEYARRVEGKLAPVAGDIRWGTEQAAFEFPDRPSTIEKIFPVRRELSAIPLAVSSPGGQKLFTTVKLEAWPRVFEQPRQDRGFFVRRSYTRLDESNQSLPMDNLRVGDRVLITLDFEVRQTAHYLAIDDPLPAIFEAVNPEFKTQATSADQKLNPNWVSDFHELRTDRALFFRNHLPPGTYKIQYLARVRSAGAATAPGTKVEEMYHPERFGLSESARVTSYPLHSL